MLIEAAAPTRSRVHFEPQFVDLGNGYFALVSGEEILASTPAQVAHPLGPPTVSGTSITVDMMLKQPVRITRMIMDMTLQRFVADRIFSSGGGVTGGAVVYDSVEANDAYASRDVERIAPGAEFPIITSARRAPGVAEVEKWGGKVWIADEAKDRNDSILFTNQLRQLSNTIVRKINARAIQVLEAMFTAYPSRVVVSKAQPVGGWDAVTPYGATPSAPGTWPAADFAMAAEVAETDELGIRYDLWILNPVNYTDLLLLYGGDGIQELLSTLGLEIYVTNRVVANTAYVVAQGQVGQMRTEQALRTETWREPNRERTWVQSGVRPLMFVDNRFAALKVTNLKG
jgi:phosphohistidine swiveling domain-containing protein